MPLLLQLLCLSFSFSLSLMVSHPFSSPKKKRKWRVVQSGEKKVLDDGQILLWFTCCSKKTKSYFPECKQRILKWREGRQIIAVVGKPFISQFYASSFFLFLSRKSAVGSGSQKKKNFLGFLFFFSRELPKDFFLSKRFSRGLTKPAIVASPS